MPISIELLFYLDRLLMAVVDFSLKFKLSTNASVYCLPPFIKLISFCSEYDSNVITICNIRDPTTSIVLSKQYTDTVGSRWRLNVYPKGNNTNQRYLSTYVELCDGIAGR